MQIKLVETVGEVTVAGDPFSTVHRALWTNLESNLAFTNVVRKENRIKFLSPVTSPIPETIQDANLPEIRLVPSTSTGSPHMSPASNLGMIVLRYECQGSTGQQTLDLGVYPLMWIMYRALRKMVPQMLAVEFNGRKIVHCFKIIGGTIGVSDQDLNRGIDGWSFKWDLEVHLNFKESEL